MSDELKSEIGFDGEAIEALTAEEQIEIQNLDYLQRQLFADYLLDHHSSAPDPYEGWCRGDFLNAFFSGPAAFRSALEFVRNKGKRKRKRKKPNDL